MKRFFPYCFVILISFMAYNAWSYTPEDCIRCHKQGSTKSTLHISINAFQASIHGSEITCQNCHKSVKDENHERMKYSGAVGCTQCHEQENRHGLQSTNEHRPRCYSCHTKHAVFEKESELSSVNSKNLKKTCKTCHPAECGTRDYMSWLSSLQISSHNKQNFSRTFDTDNCVGCHQGMAAHGEHETLNDQDCHKCHLSPEGESLLLGYIHPKADLYKYPSIFAAGAVYLLLILVLFSGGFAFYIRKFSKKRNKQRS